MNWAHTFSVWILNEFTPQHRVSFPVPLVRKGNTQETLEKLGSWMTINSRLVFILRSLSQLVTSVLASALTFISQTIYIREEMITRVYVLTGKNWWRRAGWYRCRVIDWETPPPQTEARMDSRVYRTNWPYKEEGLLFLWGPCGLGLMTDLIWRRVIPDGLFFSPESKMDKFQTEGGKMGGENAHCCR